MKDRWRDGQGRVAFRPVQRQQKAASAGWLPLRVRVLLTVAVALWLLLVLLLVLP